MWPIAVFVFGVGMMISGIVGLMGKTCPAGGKTTPGTAVILLFCGAAQLLGGAIWIVTQLHSCCQVD